MAIPRVVEYKYSFHLKASGAEEQTHVACAGFRDGWSSQGDVARDYRKAGSPAVAVPYKTQLFSPYPHLEKNSKTYDIAHLAAMMYLQHQRRCKAGSLHRWVSTVLSVVSSQDNTRHEQWLRLATETQTPADELVQYREYFLSTLLA